MLTNTVRRLSAQEVQLLERDVRPGVDRIPRSEAILIFSGAHPGKNAEAVDLAGANYCVCSERLPRASRQKGDSRNTPAARRPFLGQCPKGGRPSLAAGPAGPNGMGSAGDRVQVGYRDCGLPPAPRPPGCPRGYPGAESGRAVARTPSLPRGSRRLSAARGCEWHRRTDIGRAQSMAEGLGFRWSLPETLFDVMSRPTPCLDQMGNGRDLSYRAVIEGQSQGPQSTRPEH